MMFPSRVSIVVLTTLALAHSFAPQNVPSHSSTSRRTTLQSTPSYYFADLPNTSDDEAAPAKMAIPTKTVPKKSPHAQHGVFSPAVLALKDAIGNEDLNKLRAKMIKLHSDVIGGFVETANSSFGQNVLRQLFRLADRNTDGRIQEDELQAALRILGFDWLKDKQVKGIFQRADKDQNGSIDLEEWMSDAPRTLKTNLIKLAKKNGQDMGLLA